MQRILSILIFLFISFCLGGCAGNEYEPPTAIAANSHQAYKLNEDYVFTHKKGLLGIGTETWTLKSGNYNPVMKNRTGGIYYANQDFDNLIIRKALAISERQGGGFYIPANLSEPYRMWIVGKSGTMYMGTVGAAPITSDYAGGQIFIMDPIPENFKNNLQHTQ